jgi:epoxide hydrolase 4
MSEQHSTVLRGLKTAWIAAGNPSQPILLFLHGYPDSPETWQAQIEYFSRSYYVVAPYTRGAGPSEPARDLGRYRKDALTLDALELLDVIDPSRARKIVCIGHDLGAVHAWNLAPLLGDRLAGVVILNGLSLSAMAGRLGALSQHQRSWYIYAMQLPWLPEWAVGRFKPFFLELAHSLGKLPKDQRPPLESVEDCVVAPLNQYRAFVRDIPQVRRERMPRLKAPLLVVWGKSDPFLLTPALDEWQKAARDVTSRLLRAGHWVHRELPDEVNRLMEKFFEEKGIVSLRTVQANPMVELPTSGLEEQALLQGEAA